jgi:prolyl 4-hydroxylase
MSSDGDALLAAAESRLRAGDAGSARELLQQAAQADRPGAAVQLAIWELAGLGGPMDVAAAAGRLRRAAEAGDAKACGLFAQLVAAGAAGMRRDFDEAVDWLIRAATGGDVRAAVQLAMLIPADAAHWEDRRALVQFAATSGEPVAGAFLGQWGTLPITPDLDWERVRERVRLPHERALPEAHEHTRAPRVVAWRGLFTRDEAIYVSLRGLPLLRPARVVTPDGRSVVDPIRSNDAAKFGLLEADVVVQSLDLRIATALAHPAENGEGLALLRYQPGQQYLPHCDWIDPRRPATRADLERRGQRVATCVVYLNEGFEGGATEFPKLGFAFRGGVGDALGWENVRPDGEVDPMTVHAGRPPTRGVKFLLSKWMRDRSQGDHDS